MADIKIRRWVAGGLWVIGSGIAILSAAVAWPAVWRGVFSAASYPFWSPFLLTGAGVFPWRNRKVRVVCAVLATVWLATVVGWGAWTVHVVYSNNVALSDMREICAGLGQYSEDHGGRFPTLSDRALLARQLAPYGSEIRLASLHPLLVRPGTHIPYLANATLSGRKFSSVPPAGMAVVLYQAAPLYGERVVAIMDQKYPHAILVREDTWQRVTHHSRVLNFTIGQQGQLLSNHPQ